MKTLKIPFLILALAISAGLSGHAALAETKSSDRPNRIVSIGGSLTEIVFALGEDSRLIARDTTSTFPATASLLPDVGYIRALSPEGVLSVDPKLVIALEGAGPPEAVSVLKAADVPFISIPETFSRSGIIEKILAVGDALNSQTAAKNLADKVDRELAEVEALTSNLKTRKKVMFILSARGGKILAAGRNTSAEAIIRMAGGINAVVGYNGYKPLTAEAIITAAPDVILMMQRGGNHAADNSTLKKHAALSATPAVMNSNIIRMNALYLLGFGPRTASAIRELSTKLYGSN